MSKEERSMGSDSIAKLATATTQTLPTDSGLLGPCAAFFVVVEYVHSYILVSYRKSRLLFLSFCLSFSVWQVEVLSTYGCNVPAKKLAK
jgi:hypothetical protein